MAPMHYFDSFKCEPTHTRWGIAGQIATMFGLVITTLLLSGAEAQYSEYPFDYDPYDYSYGGQDYNPSDFNNIDDEYPFNNIDNDYPFVVGRYTRILTSIGTDQNVDILPFSKAVLIQENCVGDIETETVSCIFDTFKVSLLL